MLSIKKLLTEMGDGKVGYIGCLLGLAEKKFSAQVSLNEFYPTNFVKIINVEV